ncbi:hypothetical protein MOUN0_K03422 [Monosporozyma unispora]|nr:hypothetical protein C6P44_000808 [Kazachstania unispora]
MISYNDIFERAVQDPCSEACDCEDSPSPRTLSIQNPVGSLTNTTTTTTTNNNVTTQPVQSTLPHKLFFTDVFDDEEEDEEDDDDDSEEGLNMDKHRLRKINTIPIHAIRPIPQRPKLRNRANSCALIHQLYRSNSNVATPVVESPLAKTHSVNYFPPARNGSVCNNYTTTSTSQTQDLTANPLRRQSSCLAIPTHIYGLEKYVSSELDELSSSCIDVPAKGISTLNSNTLPSTRTVTPNNIFSSSSSTATLSSISSSSSDINTKKKPCSTSSNSSTTSPLKKWKKVAAKKTNGLREARKSFIKVSLANSFA